jgi:glycosyltransferase involved in cell wall biosynthesis
MALQAATGELIAFLDADDVYHPITLSILERTRAETQADVIRISFKTITSHNEPFETLSPDTCGKCINLHTRTESTIRLLPFGSATIISRNTCGSVRFLPLAQGEDVIFALDCIMRSSRIAFIDKPLLHYLIHPAQCSRKLSESLIVGTCNYIPEFASRLAKIGESDAAKADTFRYLCDILFLRVFKSWHLFDNHSASSNIKEAFWHAVSCLAQQQNFFPPLLQKFILLALNKKSSYLLMATVIWPYRLSKKINLRWLTS